MAYVLVSTEKEGEHKLIAGTPEEFEKKLMNETAHIMREEGAIVEDCVLCSCNPSSCRIAQRRCAIAGFPCEGHSCKCPNFPVCFTCIATLLYKKTNSAMRQNGRYRAQCPFCAAEFCHLDVLRIIGKDVGSREVENKKKSNTERKQKGKLSTK